MKKNIMISGASGFIGSSLLRLNQEHKFYEIRNQDIVKCEDHISSAASVEEFSTFISRNKIEAILHLATKYIREDDFNQLNEVISANYELPNKLICAASQTNVTKFIYAGSAWERGKIVHRSSKNFYAAVKKSFDPIAQYFARSKSLQVSKIILFDTYGPWDRREKIVDLIINARRQPLKLHAPDLEINLTYSYDVISAIEKLLDWQSCDSEVQEFIVRSKDSVKVYELVKIIETLLNRKLKIELGCDTSKENFLPETDFPYVPGWTQQYSLLDGLKEKLKFEKVFYD